MMRFLTCLWMLLLPLLADAQFGFRSPVTVCNFKRLPTLEASYPSGATHYWAFQNNLSDGVGAFTLVYAGATYTTGKNSQCLVVGSGDTADSGANTLPVNAGFSIVMWVMPDSGTSSSVSWTTGVSGAGIYSEEGNFMASVGSVADSLNGGAMGYDVWNLLVLTYDGTSVEKFSVNGGTFVTGTVTTEGVDGVFSFSANDGPVKYDEVATFTRALTQQEVADIYSPTFGP